jgi:hypothetical protein
MWPSIAAASDRLTSLVRRRRQDIVFSISTLSLQLECDRGELITPCMDGSKKHFFALWTRTNDISRIAPKEFFGCEELHILKIRTSGVATAPHSYPVSSSLFPYIGEQSLYN